MKLLTTHLRAERFCDGLETCSVQGTSPPYYEGFNSLRSETIGKRRPQRIYQADSDSFVEYDVQDGGSIRPAYTILILSVIVVAIPAASAQECIEALPKVVQRIEQDRLVSTCSNPLQLKPT